MNLEKKIIHHLNSVLDISHITIVDDTGKHIHHKNFTGGAHLSVVIASPNFNRLNLLDRHKLIHTALNKMIKKEIHALSIKAYSMVEWNKIQGKPNE